MNVDPIKVKRTVYNRIDFKLSERIWEEINDAFGTCWNDVIGSGNEIYKETIVDFIVAHLKAKQILFSYGKISYIVDMILEYIKMTGGFLDENRPFIAVKHKERF